MRNCLMILGETSNVYFCFIFLAALASATLCLDSGTLFDFCWSLALFLPEFGPPFLSDAFDWVGLLAFEFLTFSFCLGPELRSCCDESPPSYLIRFLSYYPGLSSFLNPVFGWLFTTGAAADWDLLSFLGGFSFVDVQQPPISIFFRIIYNI